MTLQTPMDPDIAAHLAQHAPPAHYEEVDHPQHYGEHPSGVECIDVVEWFDYLLGNAIECVWRAGRKPGKDTLTDLRKAVWYLERKIAQLEKGQGSGGDG